MDERMACHGRTVDVGPCGLTAPHAHVEIRIGSFWCETPVSEQLIDEGGWVVALAIVGEKTARMIAEELAQ